MTWTEGEPVVVVPIEAWRKREHGTVEHVYLDGSCRALGRRWRPCGREHAGAGGVRLWHAAEVLRRDEVLSLLKATLAEGRERRELLDRLAAAHPPLDVLREFVARVEDGA